jgi:Uncharacterized conserved protein
MGARDVALGKLSEAKKLSLISFSGDFDKLVATFTLATGAAAVGYEVNIFFTFWGLDASVVLCECAVNASLRAISYTDIWCE